MTDAIARQLRDALESEKIIQLKLKNAGIIWAGWVREINQTEGNDYLICKFERLLNPDSYDDDPHGADTVLQVLLSFWIEDVQFF